MRQIWGSLKRICACSMEAVLKRLLGKARNNISSLTGAVVEFVIDTDVKVERGLNNSDEVKLGLNGLKDITSRAEIEISTLDDLRRLELRTSSADGVKLDDGLEKDKEQSPELKIDMHTKSIKSRSSRRKPEKTRRVFDEEEDEIGAYYDYVDEDLGDYLSEKRETLPSRPSSPRRDEEMMTVHKNDGNSDELYEDMVLPEGTVFVQPEPAESSSPTAECESSRLKKMFKGNLDYAIIHCTACNKQIGVDGNMDIHRHPILKVLVCKKCFVFNQDVKIEKDDEGSDEQCRWCGQRGDLICCDFCHNVLCKGCIRRNLGRKELHSILDAEEGIKWKCYVCDPKPLLNLIDHCSSVIKALAKQEKKQIEQENKRKRNDGKGRGAAASSDSSISSQPVSVIRAPSVSVMGKTSLLRSPSERSEGLRQMQAARRMNIHLRHSDNLPTKETSIAPKLPFSKNGTVYATSSPRVVPTVASAGDRLPASVTEDLSLLPTMERLLSATHSMNMFLTSLKDDLRRTCGTNVYFAQSQLQKRREVATKLWRAYVAYGKSFEDATAHTNENVRKYKAVAKIVLQETSAKKRKLEFIEVSDSDEEDDDEKPMEVEIQDIFVSTSSSSFSQRVTVISNVKSFSKETERSSQTGNQSSNVENPVLMKSNDRRKRTNPRQVINGGSDTKRSCLDDEEESVIEEKEKLLVETEIIAKKETISLDDLDIHKTFEKIDNERCIDDVDCAAETAEKLEITMKKQMNGRLHVEDMECNGKNVKDSTTYSDCEEEDETKVMSTSDVNCHMSTSDVNYCHMSTSDTSSLVPVMGQSIVST